MKQVVFAITLTILSINLGFSQNILGRYELISNPWARNPKFIEIKKSNKFLYYNYVRRLNGTKECNIVGFYTKKKDTLILTSQKQPSGEKLLVEELFTSKFDSIVVNIIINYSKLFFELDAKCLIINGRTYHLHPKNYFDSIIIVKIPTQFIEYMTVEGSSYVHPFFIPRNGKSNFFNIYINAAPKNRFGVECFCFRKKFLVRKDSLFVLGEEKLDDTEIYVKQK